LLSAPRPPPAAAERAAGRARVDQDLRPGACRQRRARRAAERGQRASGHARVSVLYPPARLVPRHWHTVSLRLLSRRRQIHAPGSGGRGGWAGPRALQPLRLGRVQHGHGASSRRPALALADAGGAQARARPVALTGVAGLAGALLRVDRAPPPGRVHAALHHHPGDRQARAPGGPPTTAGCEFPGSRKAWPRRGWRCSQQGVVPAGRGTDRAVLPPTHRPVLPQSTSDPLKDLIRST
jgi:hypothetical protein